MCGTSGTHVVAGKLGVGAEWSPPHIVTQAEQERALELEQALDQAERALAQLQLERDDLSSRLHGALAEVARLQAIVASLPPPAPLAVPALPPPLPLAELAVEPPAPMESPQLAALPPSIAVEARLSRVSVSPVAGEAGTQRDLELEFLGDTHFIADFDQDIARGGVFVATYERYEPGTIVELAFEFGELQAQARGQVRWTLPERDDTEQRPGLAIFFTELPQETAAVLGEFCRVHPPRYYEV
jgi:hypothetical protein